MSTVLHQLAKTEKGQETGLRETLGQRRTEELVFALVGPAGSGVTKTGDILADALNSQYGYEVNRYKVSSLIIESAELQLNIRRVDIPISGTARTRKLQEIGNDLRKEFGHDYLAKKCVEKIVDLRQKKGGFEFSKTDPELPNVARPMPVRRAHIIDSVKHVEEVRLLQQIYGDMFWLIGVFAPEKLRRNRLTELLKPKSTSEIDEILDHDAHEAEQYGQKVRDTFDKADFFIRNDQENDEILRKTVNRYLEIVFDQNVHTPFRDEEAMYKAQSVAANSACLSRQVGAAIYSEDSELIGIGWNDVPKFKGSLYRAEDGEGDHRCYKWKGKICHNDKHKNDLYEKIGNLIQASQAETRKAIEEKIKNLVVGSPDKMILGRLLPAINEVYSTPAPSLKQIAEITNLDRLIEFSRSVHAEMEAIISAARDSKGSLRGATMYVTTFPCHSCARHIVAAGITRVVYIEPYPKSLAKDLHSDSIYLFDTETGEGGQVRFEQYQGVAPKNIIRLFKSGLPRKENGASTYAGRNKKEASPVSKVALDGFATNEILIVGELHQMEKERGAKSAR